jgi:hypothetical protein
MFRVLWNKNITVLRKPPAIDLLSWARWTSPGYTISRNYSIYVHVSQMVLSNKTLSYSILLNFKIALTQNMKALIA